MKLRAFAVLALLALACKGEQEQIQREETLKQNLAVMRRAIAAYRADHGRHPNELADLVPRHLPAIPVDPITRSTEWRVTTEETVQPNADFETTTVAAPVPVVIDVHSSAPGTDRNGVPYANY